MRDAKNNIDGQGPLKRKCKFCGDLFIPKRDWQKFCCREHQKEYWKQVQNDKAFLLKKIEQLEERLDTKQ